jgi:2,4-dienoyl-CoA reductase-like NADH-dependent reductase (Old Yellow Enzyme family)
MTERLSTWDPRDLTKRGIPTKKLINLYKRWGEGALGVLLSGNIMMEYDQRECPGNAIIPPNLSFSGDRFDAFKELSTQAKKHGSLCIGQLCHPGPQVESRVQPHPISASDVQLEGIVLGQAICEASRRSQEELNIVLAGFVDAAEFLFQAGYHGVELHAGTGYLLS